MLTFPSNQYRTAILNQQLDHAMADRNTLIATNEALRAQLSVQGHAVMKETEIAKLQEELQEAKTEALNARNQADIIGRLLQAANQGMTDSYYMQTREAVIHQIAEVFTRPGLTWDTIKMMAEGMYTIDTHYQRLTKVDLPIVVELMQRNYILNAKLEAQTAATNEAKAKLQQVDRHIEHRAGGAVGDYVRYRAVPGPGHIPLTHIQPSPMLGNQVACKFFDSVPPDNIISGPQAVEQAIMTQQGSVLAIEAGHEEEAAMEGGEVKEAAMDGLKDIDVEEE